jgi:hypothetical protein
MHVHRRHESDFAPVKRCSMPYIAEAERPAVAGTRGENVVWVLAFPAATLKLLVGGTEQPGTGGGSGTHLRQVAGDELLAISDLRFEMSPWTACPLREHGDLIRASYHAPRWLEGWWGLAWKSHQCEHCRISVEFGMCLQISTRGGAL